MKKIYSVITAVVCALFGTVIGFASPTTDGTVAVSQIDVVDYVIFAGIGIFMIGMLLILLSVYSGKKLPPDLAAADADATEIEQPEVCADALPDQAEANGEEPELDGPEAEKAETETEAKELEPETKVKEVEQEPEAEEVEPEPEAEEVEQEPEAEEYKVRITLTGTNNSDVKIAEFAHSATVGRRATNDIMISDNAVSGSHCIFTYEDGAVFIIDTNSTNGTLHNGELIDKSELKSGDLIILGKHQYKINISL